VDFDFLVLLLAGGWALLQWLTRRAKAVSDGDQPSAAEADLEVRLRQRLERLQRRSTPGVRVQVKTSSSSPRDAALQEFRRQMERIMGIRPEAEYGPLGRHGSVSLEPAEEVEEAQSLEVPPEITNLEVLSERPQRVLVDQDEAAEAVIKRRLAVADAHGRATTKADHARFDQTIRAQTPVSKPPAVPKALQRGSPLKKAVVWSEILGPPVSRR
jgi:hypothetical protein